MNETSKTRHIRGGEFVRSYFAGKSVLDIGCGADLVVPWARPFDVEHGDANRITEFLPGQAFDVVHSSHCLEHMLDPGDALAQWWRMLRTGGILITVVPDEELYEQGHWPSLFNGDHKWAFTLDELRDPWPPYLVHLPTVHLDLPGAALVDVQTHDAGYRRELLEAAGRGGTQEMFSRYRKTLQWADDHHLGWLGLRDLGWSWATRHGIPVDQTRGPAMAQLQIIVRKNDAQESA